MPLGREAHTSNYSRLAEVTEQGWITVLVIVAIVAAAGYAIWLMRHPKKED